MATIRFSWDETLYLFDKYNLDPNRFTQRNAAVFEDLAGNTLSLPRVLGPLAPATDLATYLKGLQYEHGELKVSNKGVILLRAGRGAIGIWSNGRLERHRILNRYVVRAAQGRAQSGKNRQKRTRSTGAAIRGRNETRFIEDLVTLFGKWQQEFFQCDEVYVSASPRLWGEVLRGQGHAVFSSKDPRIKRLGLQVGRPGRAELQRIVFELTYGTLKLSVS